MERVSGHVDSRFEGDVAAAFDADRGVRFIWGISLTVFEGGFEFEVRGRHARAYAREREEVACAGVAVEVQFRLQHLQRLFRLPPSFHFCFAGHIVDFEVLVVVAVMAPRRSDG